jgi:hypothetical protein
MDITCGMSADQFRYLIRLAKGANLTTGHRAMVTMAERRWPIERMAETLSLPAETVRTHLATIYVRFGVPQMAAMVGLGLITSSPGYRRQSHRLRHRSRP